MSLFRTKSIDELIAASADPSARLRRTLGLGSLVAFGIGSVIGSGIFTLTGTAAAGLKFDFKSILKAPVLDLMMQGRNAVSLTGRPGAGPAISLSFILVAIACGFAALCYAELASMIPVAGSAYTYAYATLGEIFAWIIGWDLILEYAVANMAVAVGFGAYLNDLLDNAFGFHFPAAFSNPVFVEGKPTGAIFNIPTFVLMMLLTWILVRGARESAEANNAMVLIKVAAILIFIFGAMRAVNTANWHPFMPNGFSSVLTGGAIVFFTYIGFDAVSTAAEECRNPQRDMPRGILLTLGACALLYAGVSLVLTGIAHWDTLNNDAPVANALKALGYNRIRFIVTVGALLGMTSSLLVGQYGQARIWFAMSRDRLLPPLFAQSPPALQDAVPEHLGRRFRRGHSGRDLGHRHLRRPYQYRDAVRVYRRLRGSHHPAPHQPRPPPQLPRPLGAAAAGDLHRLLPGADAEPAARNLDPLLRVAGHRAGDLFLLRAEADAGVGRYD